MTLEPKLEDLETALHTTQDPTERARLEAQVAREVGRRDPTRAIHLAESAILWAEAHGEEETMALALRGLAEARRQRQEIEAALKALRRAYDLYTHRKDDHGVLACLTGISTTLVQAERFEEALGVFDQALALAAQVGDPWLEAQLLNSLATVYTGLGDHEGAATLIERSLDKVNPEERPHAYGARLYNLGWLRMDLGQAVAARTCFERALETARRGKEPDIESLALESLAALHRREGRDEDAIAFLVQARDIARVNRNVAQEIEVLRELALLWNERDPLSSGATLERLLDLLIAEGRWRGVADTHRALAERRERAGDLAGALDQYKRFHEATLRHNDNALAERQRMLGLRFDARKASEEIAALHARAVEVVETLAKLEVQARELVRSTAPDETTTPGEVPLTPRELEVLRLVGQGHTNKGVAKTLGISSHTVGYHLAAACRKLGVRGRTQAVAAATRFGWLN